MGGSGGSSGEKEEAKRGLAAFIYLVVMCDVASDPSETNNTQQTMLQGLYSCTSISRVYKKNYYPMCDC